MRDLLTLTTTELHHLADLAVGSLTQYGMQVKWMEPKMLSVLEPHGGGWQISGNLNRLFVSVIVHDKPFGLTAIFDKELHTNATDVVRVWQYLNDEEIATKLEIGQPPLKGEDKEDAELRLVSTINEAARAGRKLTKKYGDNDNRYFDTILTTLYKRLLEDPSLIQLMKQETDTMNNSLRALKSKL